MQTTQNLIAVFRFRPFKNVTTGHILIGLLATCILTIGILYGIAARHRSRAEAFLRDFAELKLGESTFADAQRLAEKYQGIPWYITASDMRCTFQSCAVAFQFDNMPLSFVPFVHYAQFFGLIHVKDGIVFARKINYERLTR